MSKATPGSSCAPSPGQGRFSRSHLARPARPPLPEGTARPRVRKRQPAKCAGAAAAAQGAGAEAPGKGRSQFRRESGARLNPREAGPELEGEGPGLRGALAAPRARASETMEGDVGPTCAHQRSAGRRRSRPQDTRTRGRPVRGRAAGMGVGSAAGLRRRPASEGHAPSGLYPRPLASLGRRGSGRVGGALVPRLAPPPRPPIGRARASSSRRLPIGARVRTPRPIGLFRFGHQIQRF